MLPSYAPLPYCAAHLGDGGGDTGPGSAATDHSNRDVPAVAALYRPMPAGLLQLSPDFTPKYRGRPRQSARLDARRRQRPHDTASGTQVVGTG